MLTAIALPVLLLMTSFAVDLGRQRAGRRDAQAKADVIALDLARLINGGPVTGIEHEVPLAESAARNDLSVDKVTAVTWGTINSATFAFDACVTLDCVPTAVRVTVEDDIDYVFQPGEGHVSRSAVAASEAKAGFAIGSFAAAVDSGSGALLNSLVGDALNLGVLGYTGLAAVDLTYAGIAAELGLANPNELFAGNVSAFEALDAAAEILRRGGTNAAEVAVLDQVLAVPNSPLQDVSVGDIAHVEAGSEDAALGSAVNLFDLLATGAFLSNGNQGLAIPTTVLALPGVTFTGGANVIQGPREFYGPVGTPRTPQPVSQVGVNGTFALSTQTIGNRIVSTLESIVPGICGLLLLGPLLCGLTTKLITIDLTASVNLDLASARGTIAAIGCGSPKELDIDVASSLVTAGLTFQAVVKANGTTILSVPLSVTAPAPADNSTAHFEIPPDVFGEFQPSDPGSGSLGLNDAQINGLGALGTLLTPALNTLLSNTVNAVNTALVVPLSEALGIRVAGADIAPLRIDCSTVVLAG